MEAVLPMRDIQSSCCPYQQHEQKYSTYYQKNKRIIIIIPIVRVYGSHVVVAFTPCLCLHRVDCSRRRNDLGGGRRTRLCLHLLLELLSLKGNYYKPQGHAQFFWDEMLVKCAVKKLFDISKIHLSQRSKVKLFTFDPFTTHFATVVWFYHSSTLTPDGQLTQSYTKSFFFFCGPGRNALGQTFSA